MESKIFEVINYLEKYEKERNRNAKLVFVKGNCGSFFTILNKLYPNTFQAEGNAHHIMAKYNNKYYDITGEISNTDLASMNRRDEITPVFSTTIENMSYSYTYIKFFRGRSEYEIKNMLPNFIKQYPEADKDLLVFDTKGAAIKLEKLYMQQNLQRLSQDLNIPLKDYTCLTQKDDTPKNSLSSYQTNN